MGIFFKVFCFEMFLNKILPIHRPTAFLRRRQLGYADGHRRPTLRRRFSAFPQRQGAVGVWHVSRRATGTNEKKLTHFLITIYWVQT